ALNAGFDSIEHAMWADKEILELFRKTGAWLIPTVYPITYVGDTPEKMRAGPFRDAPPAVMEKLLEEISYSASERSGEELVIDADYVKKQVSDLARNADVSKFIL
ncbi:MAG: hypothetical protein WD624_04205, partial [Rhodospirillales bacterium]